MRTPWQGIAELRAQVGVLVDAAVARLFVWTGAASTSSLGDAEQAQRADDDRGRGQRPGGRVEPWGLRSRAVARGTRFFGLRLGSSNVFFLGVAPSSGYGPSDLAEGETALYCGADGTVVKLDRLGGVTVQAAPNASVTVKATGTGAVNVVADAATGAVGLGPTPVTQVLVQGSVDGLGFPVQQSVGATSGGGPGMSIVKSG